MADPDNKKANDFASMLAEFEAETGQTKPKRRRELEVGEQVKGRIVSVGRDSAFVAIGGKAEGVLDLIELRDAEGKVLVKVGDEIEARVVEVGDQIRLRRMAGRASDADDLRAAYEAGLPVEGRVAGVNKGGLEVELGRARGFCPMSQIDVRPVEDVQSLVGQRFQFRITKLETSGGRLNLVVSRRAILDEEQRARAQALRGQLQPGTVVHGRVTSVRDYGAFVDLGGIEGLIHRSELGFRRVDHPSEILKQGQELDVVIIKIERDDAGKERFALSLKSLEADPWQAVQSSYFEGVRKAGTVRRLEAFGAFIELEPGVEGLLHISELGRQRRIKHPKDVLKPGQALEVVVLSVDFDKRRIALGMPASAEEVEEKEAAARAPEVAAATPKSLGTFGDLLSKKKPK